MAEHIVEMMDFVCFGGNIQQLPTGEVREAIVRCCNCKYCYEDGWFFVCRKFDCKVDVNTGENEPRGFCAWGDTGEL